MPLHATDEHANATCSLYCLLDSSASASARMFPMDADRFHVVCSWLLLLACGVRLSRSLISARCLASSHAKARSYSLPFCAKASSNAAMRRRWSVSAFLDSSFSCFASFYRSTQKQSKWGVP